MQRAFRRIEDLAESPVPLLILGETGTGKDLCARAVAEIAGMERAFLTLNCAALGHSLVDSELFGHRRGAFTGAVRDHTGLLQQAHGGILFLDEIAELPLSTQAKLLRAVESGRFRPVGGEAYRISEFRLIAATNAELEQRVERGAFRADLYHRLGAARIRLPPLRDRGEDIKRLARHFLEQTQVRSETPCPGSFSAAALELLATYTWPGNVRQLKNVVEAAAALARGHAEIDRRELQGLLTAAPTGARHTPPDLDLTEVVRRAELEAIRAALVRTGGHRGKAAALLGISRATLYRRLELADEEDGPAATRTA